MAAVHCCNKVFGSSESRQSWSCHVCTWWESDACC